MHNSRKTDIKEAWGNDTGYDYIPTPGISAEPTNGHITSEKTRTYLFGVLLPLNINVFTHPSMFHLNSFV